MPFGGLLTAGIISAVGGIGSSIIGGISASRAANQEKAAGQQGVNTLEQLLGSTQTNVGAYQNLGTSSASQLMDLLHSGSLTPGAVPQFKAPTAADAAAAPNYQFALQQGNKGVLQNAAALGLSGSGGTAKALDEFSQGLASQTYQNTFSNALQGYGANLQGYNTNLAAQQQQYNQLFAPTQLGASVSSGLNQTQAGIGGSIAQLMAGIGNAGAAGSIGVGNSISGGINSALNSLMLPAAYNYLGGGSANSAPGGNNIVTGNPFAATPPTTPPFIASGVV